MKKTLLMAAAALAAGIISSQAGVYSQNVVGYANVPTTSGGTYALAIPFTVGSSNGANEVWPLSGGNPTLPDFSELLLWTGTGYTTYFSDSSSPSLWDDGNQNPIAGAPTLPVGKGFFLIPSGTVTNTFAGAIAVTVGSSNVVSFISGGTYLIAPAVPYSGSITNGNSATGAGGVGLSSLNNLPDFSELLVWTGTGYTTYFSDSTSPSLWDDANQNPINTAPTISVGQSVFLIPSGNFSWTVGL